MTTLVRFTLSETSLASQAGSSPAGNEPPITPNSLRRARTLNRAAIFFASADVHDDDSAFTFVVSPSCTKATLKRSGVPIGNISNRNFSDSAAFKKKSPFTFAIGTSAILFTFIRVKTLETFTPLPPACSPKLSARFTPPNFNVASS